MVPSWSLNMYHGILGNSLEHHVNTILNDYCSIFIKYIRIPQHNISYKSETTIDFPHLFDVTEEADVEILQILSF